MVAPGRTGSDRACTAARRKFQAQWSIILFGGSVTESKKDMKKVLSTYEEPAQYKSQEVVSLLV